MARQRTQRGQQLVENFMKHHEDGKSIAEIAKLYDVNLSTIYKFYLQEIAEKNGVTRESLLYHPAKKAPRNQPKRIILSQDEIREISKMAEKLIAETHTLIGTINNIMEVE